MAKERIASFLAAKLKEEVKGKKGTMSENAPGRDKSWASLEDCFFLMFVAQSWLCVNAAAEGLQKRTEMMERWQSRGVQVKESRWAAEISQRWKQPNREDRTCRQDTHSQYTICAVQSVHKRGTQTTRLDQVITDCIVIFVREARTSCRVPQ